MNCELILYELGKHKFSSGYHKVFPIQFHYTIKLKDKINFIVNFKNFLLCASAENVISIWEINKKEFRLKKLLMEHESRIIHLSKIENLHLAFSADDVYFFLYIIFIS